MHQAFLFVEHDVLVAMAMMAPGEAETDSWAHLDERWSEHLGQFPSGRLLGLHHVYTALVDAPPSGTAGVPGGDGNLLADGTSQPVAFTDGFSLAFWVAAAFAGLSLLATFLLLRRQDLQAAPAGAVVG